MIVIDRNAIRIREVAWLVTEFGHERATIVSRREYLHSTIAVIDDEQEASTMVEHQVHR